ncbi:MAG: hypothetical protein LBG64_00670 [Pseudomonadales bacterium]|jgi:hypothetical protein|nr:hypothetical protein [Pseudomonadales bacterium]
MSQKESNQEVEHEYLTFSQLVKRKKWLWILLVIVVIAVPISLIVNNILDDKNTAAWDMLTDEESGWRVPTEEDFELFFGASDDEVENDIEATKSAEAADSVDE